MFERRGREVVAGGDFRRSRRRERGAKDLVRRHFFLFFFFFACACTRPRRVKERYTLSKEKIYVVNARKKKTTRQARRGATKTEHRGVCVPWFFVWLRRSWALFAPSFLLFFPPTAQKKNTSCALEPKHICLSFSTLERSDIHTLQSLW